MKEIVFITGNKNKLREAQEILEAPIINESLDLPEIQAINVEEVLRDKAKRAFEIIQKPLIVEDSGFHINSWNEFPGALIKWVLETKGCEGICKSMENYENKNAKTKTGICYFDGNEFQLFFGEQKGKISKEPKGENGFGFDEIFIPKGYEKTMAEMTPEEKNKMSMRAIAFRKFKEFLDKDNN